MEQKYIDEMYMRRCLQLAACGKEGAPPNPMVGAVIVHNGRIIGEGYHKKCGEAHAEVNAIASVEERDQHLLTDSTIYVSLEPCAHYGKTPPCAQLIIDKQIPHVVTGCHDPFARVDGRGITMLRNAGIEVRVGVLEKECLWLNRRFITFHTLKRPYITLKWAQSKDGFIDRHRTCAEEPPVKFSTPATQALVHKLRAENGAILVGRRTYELDRPTLTVRHWYGKDPQRVLLSEKEGRPSSVCCDNIATYGNRNTENRSTIVTYGSKKEALEALYQQGVQTLLVEGGAQTLQSFIDCGLWDEARIETAPFMLNNGICAPKIKGREGKKLLIDGNSITFIYKIS